MKKIIRLIIIVIVLCALSCAAYAAFRSYMPQKSRTVFRTEKISRQDIIRSISATGTVEPIDLINVGAQVNGKIMSFGKDAAGNTIDYGSSVSKGMVMALIDDVTYKAELQELYAKCEQSEAAILSAEAAIKQAEVNEVLAKNNWERAKTLYNEKSMTRSDYDSNEAALGSAEAQTLMAKAQLAQSKAELASVKASLIKAERNLEYCTITSPVDGIVIDRRVSIGQTVVSNQSASSIFLVANEFSKMQVWVSVNEADIGSITPGMKVVFSCDAFSGLQFEGEVFRIRLNATLSSNVVTYIVEVNCDNTTGKLIPYLTANVKFIRDERRDVLSVSNPALRFVPSGELIASPVPECGTGETVLYLDNGNGKVRPIAVKTGLSNGVYTEIISSEINENDTIVTGTEVVNINTSSDNGSDELKNPFMPNMPKPPSQGSAAKRERENNANGAAPQK